MVETPGSSFTLHVQLPDGTTQAIPLEPGKGMSIGRMEGNDLILDYPSVSRLHARLFVEVGQAGKEQVFLEDLGSSNGTFIGEERLKRGTRYLVKPGAALRFGEISIKTSLAQMAVVSPTLVSASAPGFEEDGSAGYAGGKPARSAVGLPGKQNAGKPPILSKRIYIPGTNIYIPLGGGVKPVLIGGGIGAFVLVCACVALVAAANVLRAQRQRNVGVCDQPGMRLISQGGQMYNAAAVKTALPGAEASNLVTPEVALSTTGTPEAEGGQPGATEGAPQPLMSMAFLELPFPYDGGNENFGGTDEQFRRASQRNTGLVGRLNSFFDHYLPLYPAPKDPGSPGGEEPAEAPIGKNILLFDGSLNPYFSYSGHPGIDFSTFEYRQPTTPLFAAADGVIYAVGKHSSGALYVKIKHTVQGVGDFLTIYWHLHPDDWYNAMLGREGQPIKAGTRIGTMGNTGFSTGHHLHFEVRFDRDGNGTFAAGEAVDPYGYIPSAAYPDDPWYKRTTTVSNYLWIHPLGTIVEIPDSGGGLVEQPGRGGEFAVPSLCAEEGALPPGGTIYFSWAPDPAPSPDALGTGNGCVLSVLDANGNPVDSFDPALPVTVSFTDDDIKNVNKDSLKIYWLASGSQTWEPLDTQVDFEKKLAMAYAVKPGKCSLMGKPTLDVIAPTTVIEAHGETAPDGSFYDQVQITLRSSDPAMGTSGGIRKIMYSLDNGTTWLDYTAPFFVQPDGIPQPVLMDAQFFGGLPGTFLILAAAVDNNGNIEQPPATLNFSIDPSKNPNMTLTPTSTATATSTATSTPTATPTPTSTSTPTSEVCEATLTLTKNVNCRKGPGTVYDILTSYATGQEMVIAGRNNDPANLWWYVEVPNIPGAFCWVSDANVQVTAAGAPPSTLNTADCMPVIPAPPTPTPAPPTNTPTPAPSDTTPPPPPLRLSPADGYFSAGSCPTGVTLSWLQVNDPSGIDRYEWQMERLNPLTGGYEYFAGGSTSERSVGVSLGCGKYRWRVRAVDGAGNNGAFSTWQVIEWQYLG